MILLDQPNWMRGRQSPNQNLTKRNSGRGNLRYERRDIFGLV
jgi:hypothetical protein